MKAKWMLLVTMLFFVCSLCSAEACIKLKAVSCGEVHSLALADDNSLLACGSNANYVLGIGQTTDSFYTLQDVNDINGVGGKLKMSLFSMPDGTTVSRWPMEC